MPETRRQYVLKQKLDKSRLLLPFMSIFNILNFDICHIPTNTFSHVSLHTGHHTHTEHNNSHSLVRYIVHVVSQKSNKQLNEFKLQLIINIFFTKLF